MKTLGYLVDLPLAEFRDQYCSDFDVPLINPMSIATLQAFRPIDISISPLEPSFSGIKASSYSLGKIAIIDTELSYRALDEPDSPSFNEIVDFDLFLTSNLSSIFILRFDSEVLEQFPLGYCWPMFPHAVERFYQWLFHLDPARWTILNEQPRRTAGALETMEGLLNEPIRPQLPVSRADGFAFTDWPEVKGDQAKAIMPSLEIDETVIYNFLCPSGKPA